MKYSVRKGDTIFTLAVLYFYNWDMWPLIYYYNIDIIGDDPFTLETGITLTIPEPKLIDTMHIAAEGDTSISLSNLYYGIPYYHRLIEEANNWPADLTAGYSYKIPALCSRMEYDAATDLRRKLNVEFDK